MPIVDGIGYEVCVSFFARLKEQQSTIADIPKVEDNLALNLEASKQFFFGSLEVVEQ